MLRGREKVKVNSFTSTYVLKERFLGEGEGEGTGESAHQGCDLLRSDMTFGSRQETREGRMIACRSPPPPVETREGFS